MNTLHTQRLNFIAKWIPELLRLLPQHTQESLTYEGLSASDFHIPGIEIMFEDGSTVRFNYAFYVRRQADESIVAVFSEHNGYHEYALGPEDSIRACTMKH